jgi:hypothetical protein
MSITVLCPNEHLLKIKDKYAGKKGLCPICKARVQAPFPNTIRFHGNVVKVPATRKEPLDLPQSSRLLSAEQFEKVRAAARDDLGVKTIAKTLLKAGLITDRQCDQLVVGRCSFFLGNCRLLRLLGRSSMGCVFLGEHVTMRRRVVVKTVSRRISKAPASLERFFAEAHAIDYLAPEQALRRTAVDQRVDIYSLGCTLYYVLTGRPPFSEEALHERPWHLLSAEPESISSFRSDVPEELIGACEKMMARDPGQRYSTAREVREALGKIRFERRWVKTIGRVLTKRPSGSILLRIVMPCAKMIARTLRKAA